MKNDNNNNNKSKIGSFQRFKAKILMGLLRIFGGKKEYRKIKNRIESLDDITPAQGAETFGLYGVPDCEYDNIYNQTTIDNKYRYIRIKTINGGVIYEGGGTIYIHNFVKGTIYAPNSRIYIRRSTYGLIEADNSKISIRESNMGYIHAPRSEVLIGGCNYGFIYVKDGKLVILGKNSGLSRGKFKKLTLAQKDQLLGI